MDNIQVCSKKWALLVLIISCGIFVVFFTGFLFHKQSFSLNFSRTLLSYTIPVLRFSNTTDTVQETQNPDELSGTAKETQNPDWLYRTAKLVPNNEMLEKYLANRTKNITINGVTVYYGKNVAIPPPPKALQHWPEESFIYDPLPSNLTQTVFPKYSVVKLTGPGDVKLGDKIRLRIELYDGMKRKRNGGDLVRAWMRETGLEAASAAIVTDNQDGSYDVIFDTFWTGRPQIRLAVISPREVIATQFRRRYMYPTPLMNTGEFGNSTGEKEVTTCGPISRIPGYSQTCNLTKQNYGLPWYCGKPRSKRCDEWSLVSDVVLWDRGFDKKVLSPIELQLFTRNYQAMMIPHNISVSVKSDLNQTKIGQADRKCNVPDRTHTWVVRPPTGYFYRKLWTSLTCRGRDQKKTLDPCLKNTSIVLIGDSTIRQFYSSLVDMIPCTWGTEKITKQNKHKTFKCENKTLGYSVEYHNHHQPFCAMQTGLQYFKSMEGYLEPFLHMKNTRVVVVIHIFSHFINHHSFVFYNALKPMKRAIKKLLDTNPNAFVVIKGAHSYAFELNHPHKFPQKPEVYMEHYNDYLYKEFHDVHDRVIFLDAADITVASEQNFIHPAEFVVRELIKQVFDFVCPY